MRKIIALLCFSFVSFFASAQHTHHADDDTSRHEMNLAFSPHLPMNRDGSRISLYRISCSPNKNFSLQFSQGFLKSPEAIHPAENIVRTTASALHSGIIDDEKFNSSALVYGLNTLKDENENSFLFETNYCMERQKVYCRY